MAKDVTKAIKKIIMGKVDRKFLVSVKVISGELQHNLVVVDIVDIETKKRKQSASMKVKNVEQQN